MVDTQDKIVQLRVFGQGKGAEIGAAIALELEDQIYLPIHDHSGNVAVLIDFTTKNLAEGYVYTAFGQEQRYGSGTSNPWHYSSKRLDPETGWIYFGRRYYDPATGRWTTPDPIGFADGPNLYAYVKNNPLTHFDHYGLRGVPPAAGNAGSGTASGGRSGVRSGAPCTGGRSDSNRRGVEFSRPDPSNFRSNNNRRCSGRLASPHLPKVTHFPYYDRCFFFGSRSKCCDLSDLGLAELPPNMGIGYINGVFNDLEAAKDSAEYISKLAGGYNIQFVHNATHGYYDLYECELGLDFIGTTPVGELHNMWDSFFNNSSSDAKFLQICHSQGAIHVRNGLLSYSPERGERILVVAMAPGAYVYEETCADVLHYRAPASRDPIPRIDRAGALRAGHTIINLESHPNAPWFDHPFQSPTFGEVLQKHLDAYIQSYGERI